MSDVPVIETDALAAASAVLCKNFPAQLRIAAPGKVVFVFDDTPEVRAAFAEYYSGKMVVAPVLYDQTRADLLSRVRLLVQSEKTRHSAGGDGKGR